MQNLINITVNNNFTNTKLVNFIIKHYNKLNIAYVQKLIRKGNVKVNNKVVSFNYLLQHNDIVLINLQSINSFVSTELPKKHININSYLHIIKQLQQLIIYNDDDFIAINKPAGLSVQGGSGINFSIANALNYLIPNVKLQIVHRLDKDTTGVLLLAKNNNAAQYAFNLFKEKLINKFYYAIVFLHSSTIPTIKNGKIVANLLKSSVSSNLLSNTKNFSNEKEKVIVDAKGKIAITNYNILQHNNNCMLIEFNPLTGRTHQLRVHTNYFFNASIIGDYKYGFNKNSFVNNVIKANLVDVKKMYLHANKIVFNSVQGKLITIEANKPNYFINAINNIL